MIFVGALSVVGVSLAMLAAFTVLGALLVQALGWKVRPRNALFVLPFVGYASSTVLLGWGVLLNVPVLMVAVVGLAAVTLAALVRSRRRLSGWRRLLPATTRRALTTRYVWTLSLAAASSVLAVLPAVSPGGRLGFVESIGPDALGYAVSGQAVALGSGPRAIEASLVEAIPDVPVGLVLSPLTGAVYSLAEMTLQIQAEFLVGAARVGWAGPMGLLLEVFGLSSTWFAQAVLPVTALLLTALIGAYGGRKVRHFGPRSLVYIVGSVAGSVLLYSWHQGGAGQVWAVPSFLGVVLAVSGAFGPRLAIPLGSLGVASLAATYSDGIVPALALAGVLVVFALVRAAPEGALRRTVMIFSAGLVLFLPVLFRIPQTVLARSLDSAQAGWEVPTALSLPSLLGLMPLLESAEQGPLGIELAVQRAQTFVLLVLPILVLGVWLLAMVWWNRRRLHAWLASGLAALLVLALVFLSTQAFGEQRNYQLVKAAALLSPLVLGGMAFGIGWRSLIPVRHRGVVKRSAPAHGSALAWLVSVVAVVLLVTSTVQWIGGYRATATYVDGLSGLEYSTEATDVLDAHTFVLPVDSHAAWSLATAGNFSYANRPQVKSLTRSGPPREVVLAGGVSAITDAVMAGRKVGEPLGTPTDETDALVSLQSTDAVFEGRSGADNCQIAGILWAATGRQPILGCDPGNPDDEAVSLGSPPSRQGFTAQQPCTPAEELDAVNVGLLLGAGYQPEPGLLLSSGDATNALRVRVDASGVVALEQLGSGLEPISLGTLDSSGSNFIHVQLGGGRATGVLNGRETSSEWPDPVACSTWTLLEGGQWTWNSPPVGAVVSGQWP
ncbi:MAG: hypothetical protein K9G28_10700 [Candidatus Nanopelagicales bacterium]|nr:hypothetical protein [Candidatus Nanopelagicales bacterium]